MSRLQYAFEFQRRLESKRNSMRWLMSRRAALLKAIPEREKEVARLATKEAKGASLTDDERARIMWLSEDRVFISEGDRYAALDAAQLEQVIQRAVQMEMRGGE